MFSPKSSLMPVDVDENNLNQEVEKMHDGKLDSPNKETLQIPQAVVHTKNNLVASIPVNIQQNELNNLSNDEQNVHYKFLILKSLVYYKFNFHYKFLRAIPFKSTWGGN